jgi:signal transduction histidine kinase
MLASRPAAATLLRPVLWVGSMTDVRSAADIGTAEENLLGEVSVGQLVRFAALGVVTLNAMLAAIELGRLALATASASHAGLALLATACLLPLHLRHVVYGLRGVRPPYGYWTLTALATVNIAATVVIGQVWLMNFALFAVSALIVLPARWAVPAFVLIVLSTGPLAGPSDEFSGSYLIFSVAWRSITLFVLVWLVAAYRQLDAARREFRDQAVVRDRLRIQSELRRGLGRALEGIVARSSRASAAAEVDTGTASKELEALVEESRSALADARRVITGYQRASIRGELDAALALLETAGVETELVIATERPLDAVDERARQAIRSAVVRALGDDLLESCMLELADNDRGELTVRLVSTQKSDVRLEHATP